MGGAVFNLDYYLKKARLLEEMGSDSLCIKDMAGILAPYDAYVLFKALKKTVKLPPAASHPLHGAAWAP